MNAKSSDPVRTLHGIDFSGDVKKWTPGCGRSSIRRCKVWFATAEADSDALRLVGLRPVQHLPGSEQPFERLVALLAHGDYCAAAIDAPFSIPARQVPEDGWQTLLRDIESFPTGRRPFAKGEDLIAYARENAPLEGKKPLRRTEQAWARRGVNTRSTLWNRPRGGAPFTVACLTLLARVKGQAWPWAQVDRGLLVEAFPAAQLREWELEHHGYAESLSKRNSILQDVSGRIEISGSLLECCQASDDALDAVLCVFAAKAAAEGLATVGDLEAAEREGWIATHPS